MRWQEEYRSKLVTPEKAVSVIESNSRVVVGNFNAQPDVLLKSLCQRRDELRNVEIVQMVAAGPAPYAQPGMQEAFRPNVLFAGPSTRDAVASGRADYTPCRFFEIPRLFYDNLLPVDVAMICVSPPDRHGFCSFGIGVDYAVAAASCARVVIAEVRSQMPRTMGNFIHISNIDWVVESEEPLREFPPVQSDAVIDAIGHNVAELIPDGATLQLGIGGIPDAVARYLTDRKDLGIHSEMFSDSTVDLVEKGVITNQLKEHHRGRLVATFLMGTRKLYDFVDDNPMVEMLPVDYVNDPAVIGQLHNLISINSAVEVDLMGQVNAEAIGGVQISAVGGQMDFVEGARRSPGGMSIIAMPSTAAGGKVSRIVPYLNPYTPVTTPRYAVDVVVTEYGVAYLRGKSLRQRAEALMAIAHPRFQSQLEQEWKEHVEGRKLASRVG